MEPYRNSGPVDCEVDFDTSNVEGKTALITGGANGIGEVYVRSLIDAGAAHVLIADVDNEGGRKLVQALSPDKATFVHCDVTSWQDQVAAFRKAKEVSSTGRIDIVVSNAGILRPSDDIHAAAKESENGPPDEPPNMSVTNVNGIGSLYTVKLAIWYFSKQQAQSQTKTEDQCLVIQASIAGYIGIGGPVQYDFTKWGMRGVMRALRETAWMWGVRVNLIAPW
jgi:NAD(P)-dependent dehydrogenase (short-subunit alcohol dehydrogenase family)